MSIRLAVAVCLAAAVTLPAQEQQAKSQPPVIPVAFPLCTRFPGGPLITVDASGALKAILNPGPAMSLEAQVEALRARFDILVKESSKGGVQVEVTPRQPAPAK